MNDTRHWEDLCRRCGRCCYEKLDYEGEIHYTDTPCRCLDLQTRLCTVYPERHSARPGCTPITPENAARGILPADCPYVAGIPGYRPPRLWDDDVPEAS
ncbi:hypothetical protein DSOUD_1722 [Desulfuromonas soudanensis]|uniref:YcgN family cysteine cluster protein n=1 Tax=Desulfuromonas soudanensis TaxID=1603606 RepID=A0A0M4DHG2_9BACT|nr:hypothetical protein [Desulfuromonas soudanensis]ALC16500.1 hypothetical protein DSOUD_1722 [Desulfuromonas soudanensis]